MAEQRVEINRTLVGLVTIACFVAAAAIWVFDLEQEHLWLSGFIRVGLLMGALWLALPSGRRPAAWAHVSPATIPLLLVAIVILIRVPFRIAVLVLVVLVVAALVLRPRGRPGHASRTPEPRDPAGQ